MNSGQTTITDISDGKITGSDVSFCVVHTFNDNTVTNKYSGTLANGVIKDPKAKHKFAQKFAVHRETAVYSFLIASKKNRLEPVE